jgi:hypothetical protein
MAAANEGQEIGHRAGPPHCLLMADIVEKIQNCSALIFLVREQKLLRSPINRGIKLASEVASKFVTRE